MPLPVLLNMTYGTESQYHVKTSKTIFKIVEFLNEQDGATLTETAETINKSMSATHNHLKTLEDIGYVVNRNGEYNVGLKFLQHGIHALRKQEVVEVSKSTLEKLADDTEEIIWLVTEEHGKTIALAKDMGERAVQTDGDIGRASHMHCTANGKAILASFSDDRVKSIVEMYGLPQRTPHTITQFDELEEELQKIREQGYAINDQESVEGVRAIGASITTDGTVHGAISITGPLNRMTDSRITETLAAQLLGAIDEVQLRLIYDN